MIILIGITPNKYRKVVSVCFITRNYKNSYHHQRFFKGDYLILYCSLISIFSERNTNKSRLILATSSQHGQFRSCIPIITFHHIPGFNQASIFDSFTLWSSQKYMWEYMQLNHAPIVSWTYAIRLCSNHYKETLSYLRDICNWIIIVLHSQWHTILFSCNRLREISD